MKLTFNKKTFLKALKIGGCFAGKRKVLPILECVKLTIKENKCWIISSDERNAIKTKCDMEYSEGDISFCIKKNDIERYVDLLDEEIFNIEIESGGNELTVKTITGYMVFPTQSADEFPILSSNGENKSFKFNSGLLAYWIQRGSPFLVNDEFKLNNQNMNILIKDKRIDIFCFNDSKMYHDSSDIDFEEELEFGIDRNSFNGLLQVLNIQEEILIKVYERNILFIADDAMLLAARDEYKILNFRQLLNFKPIFEITVNKSEILSVLSRALNVYDSIFNGIIKMDFCNGNITLFAENLEGNKKMVEQIDCDSSYDYSQFYNVANMKMAINAINSDSVILCPTGDKSLMIIKNPEYETENTFISPYQNY